MTVTISVSTSTTSLITCRFFSHGQDIRFNVRHTNVQHSLPCLIALICVMQLARLLLRLQTMFMIFLRFVQS